MSKNAAVIDAKPKNKKVLDSKPANNLVLDHKPKTKGIVTDYGTEQYYTVVINANQYMGIPPFTYRDAGTVNSSFSP